MRAPAVSTRVRRPPSTRRSHRSGSRSKGSREVTAKPVFWRRSRSRICSARRASRAGKSTRPRCDRGRRGSCSTEIVAIVEAVPKFAARVNVQRFHKKHRSAGTATGAGAASSRRCPRTSAADTGCAPTLFVYDEFGVGEERRTARQPNDGSGQARAVARVIISTQAGDDQHPLSVLMDRRAARARSELYVQLLARGRRTRTRLPRRPGRPSTRRGAMFLGRRRVRAASAGARKRVPTVRGEVPEPAIEPAHRRSMRTWITAEAWTRMCAAPSISIRWSERRASAGSTWEHARPDRLRAVLAGGRQRWLCGPGVQRRPWTQQRARRPRAVSRVGAAGARRADTRTGDGQAARRVPPRARLRPRYQPAGIAFDRWQIAELERVLADEGIEPAR